MRVVLHERQPLRDATACRGITSRPSLLAPQRPSRRRPPLCGHAASHQMHSPTKQMQRRVTTPWAHGSPNLTHTAQMSCEQLHPDLRAHTYVIMSWMRCKLAASFRSLTACRASPGTLCAQTAPVPETPSSATTCSRYSCPSRPEPRRGERCSPPATTPSHAHRCRTDPMPPPLPTAAHRTRASVRYLQETVQSFDKWHDASARGFQLALQARSRERAAAALEGAVGTASQLTCAGSRNLSRCSDDSVPPVALTPGEGRTALALANSPSYRSSVIGLGKQGRAPRLVVRTYLQVWPRCVPWQSIMP